MSSAKVGHQALYLLLGHLVDHCGDVRSDTAQASPQADATDERNLTRWLEDAPALKPGSKMPSGLRELGLTEKQIEAMVAYLLTLE
jgi:hypothetical protein